MKRSRLLSCQRWLLSYRPASILDELQALSYCADTGIELRSFVPKRSTSQPMEPPDIRAYGLSRGRLDNFTAELARAEKADKDLPMKVGCFGSAALSGTLSVVLGVSHYRSDGSVLESCFLALGAFLGTTTMIAGLIGIPISRYFTAKRFSRAAKLRDTDLYRRVSNYEADLRRYEQWTRQQAEAARRRQRDFWLSLTGHEFEVEMAALFRGLGYSARVTPGTGDGGIDIVLETDAETVLVQCKAHKTPIGPHVVRDLYGTLISNGADRAILVSLSGATVGVTSYIRDKPIELITLDDILALQQSATT